VPPVPALGGDGSERGGRRAGQARVADAPPVVEQAARRAGVPEPPRGDRPVSAAGGPPAGEAVAPGLAPTMGVALDQGDQEPGDQHDDAPAGK
jgi:hypothetical protein